MREGSSRNLTDVPTHGLRILLCAYFTLTQFVVDAAVLLTVRHILEVTSIVEHQLHQTPS